jgi:molecular chaperone DnaK
MLERAVVYDLGGGTFDMSVLDCTESPFRVLARGGDLYLGGDDIDRAIAAWAAEEVARVHRWDLRSDPVVWDRLVIECERAKIRLCYAKETRIELAQVDPAAPAAESCIDLADTMLADLCMDLVKRTFVICDAVLNQAGTRAQDIDAVFLAGGATQLPTVQSAVKQYFGRTPRCSYDPMEVVGIGASVLGALLF